MRRMIPDNKWKEVKNATEPLAYDSASRKLTIDSDLQMTGDILVADPDEQSVKKIYCHPITITQTSGKNFRLACLIFNNNPTPFTLSTFKAFVDNLADSMQSTARILTTGAYNDTDSGKVVILSWFNKAYGGQYGLVGVDTDGNNVAVQKNNFNDLIPDTAGLDDGVNAIN